MTHKYVSTTDPSEVEACDCEVVDRFEFDEAIPTTLVVGKGSDTELNHLNSVIAVDEEFEVTTRKVDTGADLTDDKATIEDIKKVHKLIGQGTGDGVTVCVMDSGIDFTHPVFDETSIEKHDVTGTGYGDNLGHGTGVAGQIVRIALNVDLISLKIFGGAGSTKGKTIFEAYDWLLKNANRVQVANMSWGSSTQVDQIDRIHERLLQKGVRDVCAAGNGGGKGGSPATARKAMSVGSTDSDGNLAEFSSYNPKKGNPDLCAVGKNCVLAKAAGTSMGQRVKDNWTKASGTSFSAPVVSGAVATYIEESPTVPAPEILRRFAKTARDIPETPRDGAGNLDYLRLANNHQSSDQPMKTFEQEVVHLVREEYGNSAVETNKVLEETERMADLWFDTGTVPITAELERDWEGAIRSVGQLALYATHEEKPVSVIILPDGEIESPEKSLMAQGSPVDIYEVSELFPGHFG